MNTFSSTSSDAGTDLRFKQGLVAAMLEESNRAVLAAAGYVVEPLAQEFPQPTESGHEKRFADQKEGR